MKESFFGLMLNNLEEMLVDADGALSVTGINDVLRVGL